MSDEKLTLKSDNKSVVTNGWLKVLESEPPHFSCPFTQAALTEPCQHRGCVLWSYNPALYSCAGAFSAAKAANAEDRIRVSASHAREHVGTLRQAADGKLSFHDLAYFYGLSRQRVEGYVATGRLAMETLAPLLVNPSEGTPEPKNRNRIGSPTTLTHTTTPTGRGAPRVCVCCESLIGDDDDGVVLTILDKVEVMWCSRECANEFPPDAYLVQCRYRRHWSSVVLGRDPVDERSRVREITAERMDLLRSLALEQGYAGHP